MVNKSMTNSEQDISDIGLGASSGGLMALGINSEETILRPFIGGIDNFEIIATIISIILIIVSMIYLYYKYSEHGALYGVGIYVFSFIGLYLMLMSNGLLNILAGLFFLGISIVLVKQ
jgi:NADH:ubiquinone oxidoreductase subunit 2 (subunit N)